MNTQRISQEDYDEIQDIISDIKYRYKVYSVSVSSKTSSVRAKFTREMISDLNSFHNIDITSEIEEILKEELKK